MNWPYTEEELFAKIKTEFPKFVNDSKTSTKEKFIVLIQNSNGSLTDVHYGSDYDSAVQTCDFWDEKQNTYFVSTRDFALKEKMRFDSLTLNEKLDEFHKYALDRFNAKVAESEKTYNQKQKEFDYTNWLRRTAIKEMIKDF